MTRFQTLLLASLLAGTAPGALRADEALPPADPRAAKLVAEALQMEAKGDYAGAVIQLKNAVRQDPQNVRARRELGLADVRVGDLPGAEAALSKVLDDAGPDDTVLQALGETLLREGKGEDVLKRLPDSGRPEAVQADIDVLRAYALLMLNRAPEAQALMQRTLAAHPTAAARVALARALTAGGDRAGAEQQVDAALAQAPDMVEAQLVKADLRHLAGDPAAARTLLDKIVADHPQDIRARLGRATLAIEQNQPDAADGDIQAVLKLAPKQLDAVYLSAVLAARRNDLATARADLAALPSGFVDRDPQMLRFAGLVAYASDQIESADAMLRRVLAQRPSDTGAAKVLAAIRLKQSDPQAAYALLKPFAESATGDAQLMEMLGQASLALQKFDDATTYLQRAAKAAPDRADLVDQLAFSELRAGQPSDMVDRLEQILLAKPDDQRTALLLISSYIANKDFDRARQTLVKLRAARPDSALWDYYQGVLDTAQGGRAAARAAFEAAVARAPDLVPARMALGRMQLAAGEFDPAAAAFQAVLKAQPKNIDAMISLAEVARRHGDRDEADRWLERAAQAQPDALAPALAQIELALQARDLARAQDVAAAARAQHPDNPDILDAAARVDLAAGNSDQAIAIYRDLADRLPKSGIVRVRLAGAYQAANQPDQALEALRRGVALDPTNLAIRDALVQAELRAGHPDQAEAAAAEGQRLAPDSVAAIALLGEAKLARNQAGEAAQLFADAMAKAPSAALAARRIEAEQRSGSITAARQVAQDWLATHPGDLVVTRALATAELASGNVAQARPMFEDLVNRLPQDPAVLNNLAWLVQDQDRPRALALAGKAHGLAPAAADVTDTYGWLLVRDGQAAKGVPLLREAAGKAPDSAIIRYHLAAALAASGATAEARQVLERLLASPARFEDRADAEKLLGRLKRS